MALDQTRAVTYRTHHVEATLCCTITNL